MVNVSITEPALLYGTTEGIGFEGLAVGGRHGIHHIKVAGLNIGIGRVRVRVDLERHTVVIHLAIALVVGIFDQLDFLVMIPETNLYGPSETGESPKAFGSL